MPWRAENIKPEGNQVVAMASKQIVIASKTKSKIVKASS